MEVMLKRREDRLKNMFIGDIFKIGAKNLRNNRMRTWLTAMSIAIGVASVVLIVSMSESGQNAISNELDKLGIFKKRGDYAVNGRRC